MTAGVYELGIAGCLERAVQKYYTIARWPLNRTGAYRQQVGQSLVYLGESRFLDNLGGTER